MITKGIRISQLVERKDLNGKEIIPFQDGIHNGKLSIQSLIDYIGDISDSDLELQALIKIQKFVDTVSEMDLLLYQAKEGDIYYCKENKKLYVRSFNKWDMLDPLTSKVYVLVGLDEYNRTNIIHLWDGNDMVVMSERLFIGETTGTAYDGGKGKALADKVQKLSEDLLNEINARTEADEQLQQNINTVDDKLDKEITDRTEADEQLQQNINTVDDKLDKEITDRTEGDNSIWEVLYDQFIQISGFGVSPTIIEKGVATDINISGRFLFAGNPLTPDTLTLKMNDKVISNQPVNNLSGTKDTLTTTNDRITYSVSITAHGVTKNASATVSTYYPCYFGHTTKTIIVGTDVLSFSKQSIKSSPNGTYSMSDISQGEYAWLCIPSNFNINSVTSSGFSVPMEAAISVPVEGKGNYKCYRTSSSLVAGTFNFVIG